MGAGELPDAQCARRDDEEPMIRRVQKQSSSNCKKAMHDLDGASDQDIMFGSCIRCQPASERT